MAEEALFIGGCFKTSMAENDGMIYSVALPILPKLITITSVNTGNPHEGALLRKSFIPTLGKTQPTCD